MMCIVKYILNISYISFLFVYVVYFIRKNRGNSDDNLIKIKKMNKKLLVGLEHTA